MKLGISYWSFEGGGAGTLAVEEAMRQAKSAGYDAIELAISPTGQLNTQTDQATCEAHRRSAEKIGIRVESVAAGLTWGCSPTSPDGATRTKSIQLHADALQRAAWLGAESMLMVPGTVTIPW